MSMTDVEEFTKAGKSWWYWVTHTKKGKWSKMVQTIHATNHTNVFQASMDFAIGLHWYTSGVTVKLALYKHSIYAALLGSLFNKAIRSVWGKANKEVHRWRNTLKHVGTVCNYYPPIRGEFSPGRWDCLCEDPFSQCGGLYNSTV